MYVITTDGIPYNGLIKSETEEEIVLLKEESGEIEEVTIAKSDIQEMKKQDVSIMPGNIGEMLCKGFLRDCIFFTKFEIVQRRCCICE